MLQVMQPTRRCCKQVQSTSEALSAIWLTRLAVMHAGWQQSERHTKAAEQAAQGCSITLHLNVLQATVTA